MNAKKFSDAMSELDTKYVDEALNYKKKSPKPFWVKWGAMAACLCLIISSMFLLKHAEYNNIGGSDGIVMLFTEAEVVEVFSPRSVLVEITEENIYNANTDKNLFNVGDMVQAEFNEDIVLHFNVGDIVIIGRGNTADVDYSQKPYIAQCNNIQIKAEEDYRNIWVSAANNLGEEAAGHTFVETTYGEYLINLPEDNSCRIEDYKLLDYFSSGCSHFFAYRLGKRGRAENPCQQDYTVLSEIKPEQRIGKHSATQCKHTLQVAKTISESFRSKQYPTANNYKNRYYAIQS